MKFKNLIKTISTIVSNKLMIKRERDKRQKKFGQEEKLCRPFPPLDPGPGHGPAPVGFPLASPPLPPLTGSPWPQPNQLRVGTGMASPDWLPARLGYFRGKPRQTGKGGIDAKKE